jgi:two-component system OmpR family response regulator
MLSLTPRTARNVPRGRRALVVDDDQQIRHLFSAVLRRAGFDVEVAPDGMSAMSRIATLRPDVVTLDLILPGMDGFAVINRLRELSNAPPIVIVSGAVHRTETQRPISDPVVAFLAKPLRPGDLVAACESALRRA